MTEQSESRLNTIRSLLAKAERTNFPEEAEAYTAKAMELISKWGIDQDLLSAKEQNHAIADRIIKVHAPFAADKVRMFNAIVNVLGGRAIWIRKDRANKNPWEEMHVFATETDLERIDLLFTSLLVQCATAMNVAAWDSWDALDRPRKWKSDFLYGFAREVGQRLLNAEQAARRNAAQAARAQGTTTDIVLRNKKDIIDKSVEDAYSNLQTNKARRSDVGSGYFDGQAAGKRADLGGTRINTDGKRMALA